MTQTSQDALVGKGFKYGMVWPAVLVILLIGLFPVIYTLVVGFQNINMFDEDTRFSGLLNYERLVTDARFFQALLHTFVFLVIALPIELFLGLMLALLFLERMPGKQIFVALLVLPVVTSPIIAGAAWRLSVRQPIRADQPDPGVDHRRAAGRALVGQPQLCLPCHPLGRDLAVDTLHVPAAAWPPFPMSTPP